MNIGIIGCGHMGGAIAKALMAKNKGHILVSKRRKPSLMASLSKKEKKKLHWTVDNIEVVKKTTVVFLAVKPNDIPSVLNEIKSALKKNHILISIAGGLSLKKLFSWSGGHKKIIRILPNIPAHIFEGISVWKALSGLTTKEKRTVKILLGSFGREVEVKNEDLINVPVWGCGPAYTAAFLETMSIFAQKAGFSKEQARMLAIQTVLGSTHYIEKTGVDFHNLVEAVQTKGGITEASFKVLKAKKWQQIFEKALYAAYQRAREISKM